MQKQQVKEVKSSVLLKTVRAHLKQPHGCFCRTLTKLSRIFFEQLRTGSVLLNLGMQFVYIVSHRQKQDFSRYLLLPAQKELPKTIVLLDDAKGTL